LIAGLGSWAVERATRKGLYLLLRSVGAGSTRIAPPRLGSGGRRRRISAPGCTNAIAIVQAYIIVTAGVMPLPSPRTPGSCPFWTR
jgi:hypothetical protein